MSEQKILQGKRGGSYYFSSKGRKIYVKNKPNTHLTANKVDREFVSKKSKSKLFTPEQTRLHRINRELATSTGDPKVGRMDYHNNYPVGAYKNAKMKQVLFQGRSTKEIRRAKANEANSFNSGKGKRNGVVKPKKQKGESESTSNT